MAKKQAALAWWFEAERGTSPPDSVRPCQATYPAGTFGPFCVSSDSEKPYPAL